MRSISPKIPRPLLVRVILFILFNSFFCAWLLIKPFSPNLYAVSDDLLSGIGYLLGACFCFSRPGMSWLSYPSRRRWSGRQSVRFWVPALLALGLFCYALGVFIYSYYDFYQLSPFPSLSDYVYLCAYPLLLLAVLLLPTRSLSTTERSRVLFDSLMIMAAVITFSWYFVLGPTVLQGSASLLGQIVAAADIVGDLVIVVCLLLLSVRSTNPALRPGLLLLSLAFLIVIGVDSVYSYQLLNGTYEVGGLMDLAWTVGYMLIGLAAYILGISTAWDKPSIEEEARPDTLEDAPRASLSHWPTFLPYVLVPAVIILDVFMWHQGGQGPLEQGVVISSVLLVALLLIRQILALRAAGSDAHHMRQLNRKLSQANTQLEALATTDPLTGLPNHRSLVSLLDQELERAQRYTHTFALLFLDIDHFKALNDGYGHAVGDAVLRRFSALVRSELRSIDTIGRWGGEEFVVVLPEVGPADAYQIAERVRAVVGKHPFDIGGGLRLTCSIGIACFLDHGFTREELLQAADQAMYGAKRLGRNQIRTASDPAVLALASHTAGGGREEEALIGTVEALAALVEARNAITNGRAQQIGELVKPLAIKMGMSGEEAQMLALAGQLHDIGKVAVPDTILQKSAPLSEEEWCVMRTHTVVGSTVINHIPALRPVAQIIRAHHERWDGQGYPDQLAGTAIPLGARILAVVDAYYAMTSMSSYRQAQEGDAALAELRRCAMSQFDSQVVDALEDLLVEIRHRSFAMGAGTA